ncbi:MATE family efflux transporter [Clostridium ganghwense]|uniref:Probable multidrug resistance protein NorM n=1 Tax=Clostridium ganghwense TaxID=312089 RepID=A0ABT4CPX8_9CLOT|nr:MATE family efflux transporter [Clostridium ganghwense]MCY6370126.1 MATE family efflux transporter [Clostridium ganghwense]
MRDLTKGNEAKLIFYFTLPMLIGNVFQQLYNTIDSIIVGRVVGESGLAAVGTSFPIIFLLVSLIIGVTMGSTILIAQYYGAKDMKKVKRTIDTAYIFMFAASLIMSVLGIIFSESILHLMNTPPEILSQAKSYLNIMFIGLIAMFGYNSISAILRGLGDSKTPLYFLILSSGINIGLDLLFIKVFGWGVSGAAWATVIAQLCSFIFGVYYLNKNHKVFKLKIKEMIFDKEIFKLSLKIGLPTGVQQMLMAIGLGALQAFVNGFGKNTMAAFTAASRIDSFATMPIMNFGAAISTFVGQNLGANKMDRVKKGFKATVFMSGAFSLFITLIMFLFGEKLVRLFNTNPDVIAIGLDYLKIVSAFYVTVAITFVINGVLRGAGDTMIPMVISILSLWLMRIPVAKVLSTTWNSPNGIWWATPVAWIVGLVLTIGYYMTGKWKNKIAIKRGMVQNRNDNEDSEQKLILKEIRE